MVVVKIKGVEVAWYSIGRCYKKMEIDSFSQALFLLSGGVLGVSSLHWRLVLLFVLLVHFQQEW